MTLRLTMLPAGEGDALWLQWGPDHDRRQMLVDMGVHATGRAWRSRIEAMPVAQRGFDLLVVTHVDTDHIYGVLSALADAESIEGFEFRDVWFNGWAHLRGEAVAPFVAPDDDAEAALRSDALIHMFGNDLESYGGRQGEEFSIWLRQQPWNREFHGGPVVRPENAAGPTIELAHDLRMTVLGPTQTQLEALQRDWRKAVADALKKGSLDAEDVTPDLVPAGLESLGRRRPHAPRLNSAHALEDLANTPFESDTTRANGSSIALMLEYGGDRLLLASDAQPAGLVDALGYLYPEGAPDVTAFKLPHHGSRKNVSRELVEAVRCKHWLISTNGVKHYHPDAAAIARVLHYGQGPEGATEPASLFFNEPSTFNGWWDRWRTDFEYQTFRGNSTDGLALEISNGSVEEIVGRD
ncbi:MAG: hypothetical protein GY906_09565 [bacterium]|nr:hypothetical protein [bacterium]